MSEIIRFGVSMEKKLLDSLDRFIKQGRHSNRSEYIRNMIRERMVEEEWKKGYNVAGSIMLVYGHHNRNLLGRIMDVQHRYHDLIISTQHIHMDEENCMEIIAVKGTSEKIREVYNSLKGLKGIKHTSISKATTGTKI